MWTTPAGRSKTNREHLIPLGRRALEILEEARALGRGSPLVFPSLRGKPLDGTAFTRMFKRLGINAVPHGFRSSFRDWAAEETDHPREVAEAALAHMVRNQVEAAYRRTDLFDRGGGSWPTGPTIWRTGTERARPARRARLRRPTQPGARRSCWRISPAAC